MAFLGLRNSAWDFLGVNFWTRDFWGFSFLPPFDHTSHLKSTVPLLGTHSLHKVFMKLLLMELGQILWPFRAIKRLFVFQSSMKHFFYLFQSNPSQDVQDIDITESEIYCPFINDTKTVNHDVLSSLSISPLSIHLGSKNVKDGGRIYLDKFCSVTSILSQTKPPSEFFALKNWAKSQVSELGKEKFKEKKKSISRRGTLFHHVSTAQYLAGENSQYFAMLPSVSPRNEV